MMAHEPIVLPCCLITSLDASSFSFLSPSLLSTLSSISLPPGCMTQKSCALRSSIAAPALRSAAVTSLCVLRRCASPRLYAA
jgi:hypothetical protein